MEFYELLEEFIGAIPPGYESVRAAAEAALPWILGICSAATCFFGHTVHKIWNAFFFFWIGFLVPVFALGLIFGSDQTAMYIYIAIGIVCGGLCAFYSKKIFKVQLFVTAFIMVFTTLPSYLTFLGGTAANIIGFVIAVAAGVLSTKYKYIMTICTTAFSGAFMLFGIFEANFALSHPAASALAVITGILGLCVQCFMERKELKETWEQLKNKKNKLKKGSETHETENDTQKKTAEKA